MAANTDNPLVTVGLFVYNESPFIRDSLKSLLAQDYPNFEIIIADNCSTDDSGTICQEVAGNDPRVRYVRHESNIGAAANSIYVLEAAKGNYFMWAAGHDLWSPDLISRCVAALETCPEAAIAYASSTWIDAEGNPLDREAGWYDTRGMGQMRRFFFAFWGNLHPVLGVIRAHYLRDVPKIHACIGADQILLTELSLLGDFIHVPDTSWSRRQPRAEETHKDKVRRYTGGEFQIAGSWIDRRLPLLRLPVEQLRSLLRSRLGIFEKIAMILALFPAFLVRYIAGRKS